jgi:AcrR family transcriptional regulator
MAALGVIDTGIDVLSVSDRDRILEAMAECCAEAGYRETTVAAVVERAGLEPESFEAHFADKEDCALAALNKTVSEALARISMTAPFPADPLERRMRETKAMLELAAAQPEFCRLTLIEARQGGSARMHGSYESAARVLALMMERIVTVAPKNGYVARATLGGIEAVLRRELAAGRARRLPQLLSDIVYAALVPFVGQGEALRQAKQAAKVVAKEG